MATIQDKVASLMEVGGKLSEGGSRSYELSYPEGQDGASAEVAMVIDKLQISYPRAGMSCYMGLWFFYGNKLIEIKPVLMWRNGENARNDKPGNFWGIHRFVAKDVGYELVIMSGCDVVEIWSLEGDRAYKVRTMDKLTFMEESENKAPQDRHAIILKKVGRRSLAPYHEIRSCLYIDLQDQSVRDDDNLSAIYGEPDRYRLLFRTYGRYYGEVTYCGLYFAWPATLEVLHLHSHDSGVEVGHSHEQTLCRVRAFVAQHGYDSLIGNLVYSKFEIVNGVLHVRDSKGLQVVRVNIS